MATANGASTLFADMAMPPVTGSGRSMMRAEEQQRHSHHQQQKQKQQAQEPQRHKRPPRACTARTPSRLAPVAPSVERPSSSRAAAGGRTSQQPQHQHDRASPSPSTDPPTPMVLTVPPPPAQKQRWLLRSTWELASVINFFNVFRPVLKLKFDFTMEELESALLSPNDLLDDIHIILLKSIPPISRAPLNHETWVIVLCKKLREWWHWVAEGPFPLAPYHGEELATYKELGPEVRTIILKALCEVRLDQEDMRSFIDDTLKQGAFLTSFRKERMGVDMLGTTYWYENDLIAGQRLYRELRKSDKDKPKVRGRLVPPTATCHWETVATNLDEFQSVADKLSSSRNRLEVAIGKRINNDILPDLQEIQKKKERALKKQQRQALLLDSNFFAGGLPGGLAAGRSKRERKPVTYTFDDYDKSISEAIKITKRRQLSPEPFPAVESKLPNGVTRLSDGEANISHTESRLLHEIPPIRQAKPNEAKPNEDTLSSDSEMSLDGQSRRSRHHRKPQRYSESEFVEGVSDNEGSEDDIEGEAVYDDDYVLKKKRKYAESSDGDEEYRGDEDEEEEEEDEEEDGDGDGDDSGSMDYSDGDEWRHQKPVPRGRTRGKLKTIKEIQGGLRRSQRATRSHVDYSKYEDSDAEAEEHAGDMESVERRNHDDAAVAAAVVSNLGNGLKNQGDEGLHAPERVPDHPGDSNDLVEKSHGEDSQKGAVSRPTDGSKPADRKSGTKLRRFLDLNVAAPLGGGQDDSSYHEGSSSLLGEVENSEDESVSDGPRT